MRDIFYPFTHVCIIFALCTYAYSLMHLFMEDSGESDGPDARRHDKIALVSNDTAIAMREDSIYIRNFCSLTANTCSHIYHTRGELSVSRESPLRLLFAFVKVYFHFRTTRTALTSALIALRILNFLQMR